MNKMFPGLILLGTTLLVNCKTTLDHKSEESGFVLMSADTDTDAMNRLGCLCEKKGDGWAIASYWVTSTGQGHKREEKSGDGDLNQCFILRPAMDNKCGEELQ